MYHELVLQAGRGQGSAERGCSSPLPRLKARLVPAAFPFSQPEWVTV